MLSLVVPPIELSLSRPCSAPRWPVHLLAVTLLAGCGESTGPSDALVISLDAVASAAVMHESPDGPSVDCSVRLAAQASGRGTAVWQDATIRWFAGLDRETVLDTQVIAAAEVRQTWGDSIAAGSRATAQWSLRASVPFEAELDLRYLTAGAAHPGSATARFKCGLTPPEGGAAPPSITSWSVAPAEGEVALGDTITVTYAAASTYGLWSTAVRVSGAFDAQQVFSERMATATTRTARFVVPRGYRPGMPLDVRIEALDPMLQHDGELAGTGLAVVDRSPPVISSATPAAGQYPVGDTLRLSIATAEDNALEWMVYELGAPANVRDSVHVSTRTRYDHIWEVSLPVRESWVGAPDLTVYLRDAGGNVSAPARWPAESIRFYPVVTPTLSPAVAAPGGVDAWLGDVAHDTRRGVVYLAQPRLMRVAVLDPAAMRFPTLLALPDTVGGLDLTPGGDSLLVVLPWRRSIAIIDLTRTDIPPTLLPLTVLDTAGSWQHMPPPRPTSVRVAANGKAMVALSTGTRTGAQYVEVDLASGQQRLRTDAATGGYYEFGGPGRFGRTSDHARIVALEPDCTRSYVAANDAFTPCAPGVAAAPDGLMTFDLAGTRSTGGRCILDADLRVVRCAPHIAYDLPTAALSPDGSVAYLSARFSITTMRVADGVLLERWPLPLWPARVLVAPGGDWILALEAAGEHRVLRIDLR